MKAAAAFRLLAPVAALALHGCAVTPAAPPAIGLTNTEWRVTMVNGRATPATGDYTMRFERDGRLGGRFGCNHIGGSYRQIRGTLTVSGLMQTLMGCPEPASTFESEGSAILRQPMRIAESSSGGVTLMNGSGSIALERR